MSYTKRLPLAALLATLFLTHPVAAKPPQEKDEESRITRIYDVRWRSAVDLRGLLQPFLTRGDVSPSARFNTLTVSASEEGHALVSALLEKYDVPGRMIEFQFYLLQASGDGSGVVDGVPQEIREVLEEVASLTRFDTFELIDAPLIRVEEGSQASFSGGARLSSEISMRQVSLSPRDDEGTEIRVGHIQLTVMPHFEAGEASKARIVRGASIATSFSVVDGRTLVIGTGGLPSQDGALVAVVTARVLDGP